MKRFYVAASVLLLGTSALAYAGTAGKDSIEPVKAPTDGYVLQNWDKMTSATWDKSMAVSKADLAATETSKTEFATLDKDLEKLAAVETTDGKVLTASAETDAKVQTAWADTDTATKVETASVDKTETGMGGPLEETTASASTVVQPGNAEPELDARGIPVISDVAYVPAGFNATGGAVGGPVEAGDEESYPACTAARTDNCIQLYERGVRASLASTDKSGSDVATTEKVESDSTAGVGGPYEPIEESHELAMNGDGSVDVSKGETSDAAIETASESDASVADHSEFQGVGGPVEAQSGYPPCSPGPGDDRCIQLYERGVTGAGN